jgi:ABC-type sugar transport system substrate-binding protein
MTPIARPLVLLLLAFHGSIMAAGCQKNAIPAPKSTDGFIAFVGVGQDDPLWPVLRATAIRTHRRLGLHGIPLRTLAPRKSSANAQRDLLRSLAGEKLRGVCVQIREPGPITPLLDDLQVSGVAVVTLLNRVSIGGHYVHCGPDDDAIGNALARATTMAMPDGGTVAVLHADSTSTESLRRNRSFQLAMGRADSIHVLLYVDGRGDPSTSRRLVTETMRRYPRLKCWVMMDDWALTPDDSDDWPLPTTCRVVGLNPSPRYWPRIASSDIAGMVAMDYCKIAERAITSCATMILGKTDAAQTVDPETQIITRDNLAEFQAQWKRWATE